MTSPHWLLGCPVSEQHQLWKKQQRQQQQQQHWECKPPKQAGSFRSVGRALLPVQPPYPALRQPPLHRMRHVPVQPLSTQRVMPLSNPSSTRRRRSLKNQSSHGSSCCCCSRLVRYTACQAPPRLDLPRARAHVAACPLCTEPLLGLCEGVLVLYSTACVLQGQSSAAQRRDRARLCLQYAGVRAALLKGCKAECSSAEGMRG